MPASDATLLLLLPAAVWRADVDDLVSGRVGSVTRTETGPGLAATRVEAALASGGVGRRLFVLDPDLWLGEVELMPSATAGLRDDELAGAAAMEASAQTGLAGAEAVTAARRMSLPEEEDRFLACQAPRRELDELAVAARRAGARLAGLVHPAQLPRSLQRREGGGSTATAAGESWRRVELWPGEIVVIEHRGGETLVSPLGVTPGSAWRSAVEGWTRSRPAVDQEELLALDRGAIQPKATSAAAESVDLIDQLTGGGGDGADPPTAVVLDDEDSVRGWMSAWAAQLGLASPGVIRLRPQPKRGGVVGPVLVGVLMLAVVLGGVAAMEWTTRQQVRQLQQAADEAGSPGLSLADARAEAAAAARTVRELEEELVLLRRQARALEAEAARGDREHYRPLRRMASLLPTLADVAGPDVVIRSIEPVKGAERLDGAAHRVIGLASRADEPLSMASRLNERFAGLWRVVATDVEPSTAAPGRLWRFTLTLEPATRGSSVEAEPEVAAADRGASMRDGSRR